MVTQSLLAAHDAHEDALLEETRRFHTLQLQKMDQQLLVKTMLQLQASQPGLSDEHARDRAVQLMRCTDTVSQPMGELGSP